MPSFDVVSELNAHEVTNAVDQANREVSQRFDFKGTGARFDLEEFKITLHALLSRRRSVRVCESPWLAAGS